MNSLKLFFLGIFLLAPLSAFADQVTCESRQNGRTECEMDTSGAVRLERQLSKTRCVEDQNWGYSKYGLWVDGGCRGVFVSDGSSQNSSSSEPSKAQIAACDAVRNWSGQVMSFTALEAGAWEIILYYGDREGKYVCNVDRYLEVSYFERLINQ